MSYAQKKFWGTLILCACFMSNPLIVKAIADESVVMKHDRQNQAAEDWLELVEKGQYKGSWDSAGANLKARLTADEWKNKIAAVRDGLGGRLTRGLETREEAAVIPGWPKGKYVILTFLSSFENKQHAVETLTLAQDSDGTWRVLAYSIK